MLKNTTLRATLLILSAFFLAVCSERAEARVKSGANASKPNFCISPTFKGKWDNASREDIQKGLLRTTETGVDLVHYGFEWGHIETDKGQYDWSLPDLYMKTLRGHGVQSSVIITTDERKPEDINKKKLTDKDVIIRHADFVQRFVSRYKSNLLYLWIGNEVNLALDEIDVSAEDFGRFVLYMQKAAKDVSPNILVGTIVTFPYENEPEVTALIQAARGADLIGITFYPEFLAYKPTDAQKGFDRVEAFTKPFGMQYAIIETGWSTNALGSDEQDQDHYVRSVFSSLKKDQKPNRSFVCWWGLHDPSLTGWHKAFFFFMGNIKPWLESLGLLDNNGTPKLAWKTFQKEVRNLKK